MVDRIKRRFDLDERREAPILLHRGIAAERLVEDREVGGNASDSLRPCALATVRFMISSNLVGCSTGVAGLRAAQNLVDMAGCAAK